jgi:hypothetical protein
MMNVVNRNDLCHKLWQKHVKAIIILSFPFFPAAAVYPTKLFQRSWAFPAAFLRCNL